MILKKKIGSSIEEEERFNKEKEDVIVKIIKEIVMSTLPNVKVVYLHVQNIRSDYGTIIPVEIFILNKEKISTGDVRILDIIMQQKVAIEICSGKIQ